MNGAPEVELVSERAVLVRLGSEISTESHAAVDWLLGRIEARRPPWLVELVPAYCTLMALYDPGAVGDGEVQAFMSELAASLPPGPLPACSGRTVEIPVRYHAEVAPDLAAVADETAVSVADLVAIHTGREYLVHMLGFRPGFPFMGTLDPRIAVPRLPAPRPRVPVGSVAIAGRQTGIYPCETAGGWRIIGRTRAVLFDPARPDPFLLRRCDRVRFVDVDVH
jgi:inhibitor of KinA